MCMHHYPLFVMPRLVRGIQGRMERPVSVSLDCPDKPGNDSERIGNAFSQEFLDPYQLNCVRNATAL